MRKTLSCKVAVIAVSISIVLSSNAKQLDHPSAKARQPKRVGMVIGLKPANLEEYKRLHSDDHPGVRDLLNKYHMHNFSIFMQKMPDGKWYEFGYYEYTGDNFEKDMAQLAKEPRNIEWGKLCSPMQLPLPEATDWTEMEAIYFNE